MKKMVSKSIHIPLNIVLYVYLMSLYFQFCVLLFCQKFNMTPISGEEKSFFENWRVVCSDTLWVENFDEIAPSHTVKYMQAVSCFTL